MIFHQNHLQRSSGSKRKLFPMHPIYLFSISSHAEAIHINPLQITYFQPAIDFTNYDHLILTSKQAVKALGHYKTAEYLALPALCISQQTAQAFREIGGEVLEIGSGYGDDLEQIIQNYPKKVRWLYLRAEQVASDFSRRSQEKGFCIEEKILYKSECSQEIAQVQLPPHAILIFTSPSAVKCYLACHEIQDSQRVVVIGTTTQKALPKGVHGVLSEQKTVQSCIEIAKKLLL